MFFFQFETIINVLVSSLFTNSTICSPITIYEELNNCKIWLFNQQSVYHNLMDFSGILFGMTLNKMKNEWCLGHLCAHID